MDETWAKEHFLKYDGSYFHITRQGDIRRYKEYGISREQEIEWIREHQQKLIKKIETEDNVIQSVPRLLGRICSTVSIYKETNSLSSLLNALKEKVLYLDSFSLVRVSKDILRMVEKLLKESAGEKILILEAKQFAGNLLYQVIRNPITVDSYYVKTVHHKENLEEENIISEARALLSKWEEK